MRWAAAVVGGAVLLVGAASCSDTPVQRRQQAAAQPPAEQQAATPSAGQGRSTVTTVNPNTFTGSSTYAPAAPSTASTTTSLDTDLPAVHAVEPPSASELARKRAEWAEHERQTEQADADLQAWRRSRKAENGAVPHLLGTAAPHEPTHEEAAASAMATWYRQSYLPRSTAVTLALRRFGLAAAANPLDGNRLLGACGELRDTADAILADQSALAAPLPAVATPLTTAYAEIRAAAVTCLQNRTDERESHIAAAHASMKEAAAALRPYGLNP